MEEAAGPKGLLSWLPGPVTQRRRLGRQTLTAAQAGGHKADQDAPRSSLPRELEDGSVSGPSLASGCFLAVCLQKQRPITAFTLPQRPAVGSCLHISLP